MWRGFCFQRLAAHQQELATHQQKLAHIAAHQQKLAAHQQRGCVARVILPKPSDSPTKASDSPTKASDSPTKASDSPAKANDSPTKASDSPTMRVCGAGSASAPRQSTSALSDRHFAVAAKWPISQRTKQRTKHNGSNASVSNSVAYLQTKKTDNETKSAAQK